MTAKNAVKSAKEKVSHWGLLWWVSEKFTYEPRSHLLYENCKPVMFKTRKEARDFAIEKYGYIKVRDDLRRYPHGWRLPKPVRITGIIYER